MLIFEHPEYEITLMSFWPAGLTLASALSLFN